MSDRPTKRCLVAIDTPQGVWLCHLSLPMEATIAAALDLARQQCAPAEALQIDWEGAAVGLWGRRGERSVVPADGDRIEVYRALTADPRQRRRQRHRAQRPQRR